MEGFVADLCNVVRDADSKHVPKKVPTASRQNSDCGRQRSCAVDRSWRTVQVPGRALGRCNVGYFHITQAVMGRFEKVKHGIAARLAGFDQQRRTERSTATWLRPGRPFDCRLTALKGITET